MSTLGTRFVTPAAATTMSTVPNAFRQASRSARSDAPSLTSVGPRRARRPFVSIADATSSTTPFRRPVGTTSAPASARPSASARPMPVVPPTTTAVRPLKSNETAIQLPQWSNHLKRKCCAAEASNCNLSPATGQSPGTATLAVQLAKKRHSCCGGSMIAIPRRLALFLAAALAAGAPNALAQISGSISGTVVDQTRQLLPGATVTLVNEETGDSRVTASNEVGAFVFSAVQPGTYTIRIELSGFATVERKNTVLPPNEQLSVGAVQLNVGGLTETITLTAQ